MWCNKYPTMGIQRYRPGRLLTLTTISRSGDGPVPASLSRQTSNERGDCVGADIDAGAMVGVAAVPAGREAVTAIFFGG